MEEDYDINEAYCVNGCGKPAVAETFNGVAGENEVVDLICYDCAESRMVQLST